MRCSGDELQEHRKSAYSVWSVYYKSCPSRNKPGDRMSLPGILHLNAKKLLICFYAHP